MCALCALSNVSLIVFSVYMRKNCLKVEDCLFVCLNIRLYCQWKKNKDKILTVFLFLKMFLLIYDLDYFVINYQWISIFSLSKTFLSFAINPIFADDHFLPWPFSQFGGLNRLRVLCFTCTCPRIHKRDGATVCLSISQTYSLCDSKHIVTQLVVI